MLRSLVGSEMCIRDSAGPARPSASAREPRSVQHRCTAERRRLHAPRARVCLLYTSDAADDLLCVDLGGRRIIKKTKNTQQAMKP